MKTLVFVMIFIIKVFLNVSADSKHLEEDWHLFKHEHAKSYKGHHEEHKRRRIWESNLAKIRKHNLEHQHEKHGLRLEMNKFGDMTDEEYISMLNGYMPSNRTIEFEHEDHHEFKTHKYFSSVPTQINYTALGYVTGVKNQGDCSACWIFAAVGALEGQWYRKTGRLVSLSEQNLIDCTGIGCQGGNMKDAYAYIKNAGGIFSSSSYPYNGKVGSCYYSSSKASASLTGFASITSGDEVQLVLALGNVGPVAAGVDASRNTFRFYRSGIYSDSFCSSTKLNHAVLVVGYGSFGAGQDYYIIKNSWTANWGRNGYMLLARNKKSMCGIANDASYPLV